MIVRCVQRSAWSRTIACATRKRAASSFSFSGPRKLDEILKKEMIEDKTGPEIAELWKAYHESKESTVGLVRSGADGRQILERAKKCPFFVQPVFRESGFFNLVSQFQTPSHFLLAYLEDYKLDPAAATPLMTCSVFDDLANKNDNDNDASQPQNLTLIRADVVNKGLDNDAESQKIVESLLESYLTDYDSVETFNQRPEEFDFEDFLARQNAQWKEGEVERV